jgi:hypothetical protein
MIYILELSDPIHLTKSWQLLGVMVKNGASSALIHELYIKVVCLVKIHITILVLQNNSWQIW